MAFAAAIADILAQSNVQIIWKFNTYGEVSEDYLALLKPYLGDRLLMPDWLGADPYALLESGHIAVSVHHGGPGCYHEAIS
ncbi:hypothetical protein IMZ48_29620 [Candidatus Bathyarchaeota archaeon]|nr:hypothetical protein [Candidatus Bathyarchaeota archaeon]